MGPCCDGVSRFAHTLDVEEPVLVPAFYGDPITGGTLTVHD